MTRCIVFVFYFCLSKIDLKTFLKSMDGSCIILVGDNDDRIVVVDPTNWILGMTKFRTGTDGAGGAVIVPIRKGNKILVWGGGGNMR
jgi:hypothetical protein